MSNRMLDTLEVFKTKITKEDIDSIKDKSSIEDFNKKVVHHQSMEDKFEDWYAKGARHMCTSDAAIATAFAKFCYEKEHKG